MGKDTGSDSGPCAAGRWPRQAGQRQAAGAGRGAVDFTHRCPLERSASTVPSLPDLSPQVSAVATTGCDAAGGGGAGARPDGAGRCGLERVLY